MPKKCEKRTIKSRACVPLKTDADAFLLEHMRFYDAFVIIPWRRHFTRYVYLIRVFCVPAPSLCGKVWKVWGQNNKPVTEMSKKISSKSGEWRRGPSISGGRLSIIFLQCKRKSRSKEHQDDLLEEVGGINCFKRYRALLSTLSDFIIHRYSIFSGLLWFSKFIVSVFLTIFNFINSLIRFFAVFDYIN